MESKKPTKEELLEHLDKMIDDIEKLPANAKVISVNQFDMLTLLYLLSAIFRCNSDT